MKKEGSIFEVLRLAYPLIISTASMTIMQFVHRIFLAWYSTDAIAASVPAAMLSSCVVGFFSAVGMYTNVIIAYYYGAKQYDNVILSLFQGIIFFFLSSIVILAFIPLGIFIIEISAHPEHVKTLEIQYYSISIHAGIFLVLNSILSAFFTGQGKTKLTMIITAIGNFFNIVCSWFLIFGYGGFPELGIRGAAFSMLIGNIVMSLLFGILIILHHRKQRHRSTTRLRFSRPLFKKFMQLGLPSGLGSVLNTISFLIFVYLIGNLGKVPLAANNIIMSLKIITFLPIKGISAANTVLVGQYIGKGKKDISVKTTYSTLKLGLFYTAAMGLSYLIFPQFFINLFHLGNDSDFDLIKDQSHSIIKIFALFIFCDTFNLILESALKGAGDTKFYMKWSVLCDWLIFVPGSVFILTILRLPPPYAWAWAVVWVSILGAIFYARFRSNKWQKGKGLGTEE